MSLSDVFPDGFLTFLPLDNDSVTNADSERFMDALSEDLSIALRLTDNDFWELVKSQDSLSSSLDSFLRFRRRGLDEVSESSMISKTLEHRVFLIFTRLVTVPEKSNASFRQRQASILYDNWIIDVPKILDLCCLYGKENGSAVQELLQKLFQLQPKYLNDLREMVPTLVDNLYLLEDRCVDAIVQIQQGNDTGLLGWNDVFQYLLDVCFNLCAFLEVYPAGGSYLVHSKGILISTLAQHHDNLLPQFDQVVRGLDAEEIGDLHQLLKMSHIVLAAIQKTAFTMFKAAYLTDDTIKPHVAMENGQQLMSIIMSCARNEEKEASTSLLCKINTRFQLGDLIVQSIEKRVLSLDDAQFDYLSMLFSANRRPQALLPASRKETVQKQDTSRSSTETLDVEKATLLSKANQIKDILPNYGDGFLVLCLKEYNMDHEKVIAHLLEGSLPPTLSCLDPLMELKNDSSRNEVINQGASSSSGPAQSVRGAGSSSTFQFFLPDAISFGWDVSNPEKKTEPDIKKWAQVKVAKTNKKIERRTAKVLNQSDADIRQMIIQQANELLLDEYEDEYDDSFGDLGTSGADGLADVEGDFDKEMTKDAGNWKKSQKPYYVKDRKIYNAPVEGGHLVHGHENAQKAASQRDAEIYGLGPGGNIPENANGDSVPVPVTHQVRGRGRGRGGGRGQGRNHHRKERNLRKQQF